MMVDPKELTTIAMVAGNEKKYTKVVDGEWLKEWVGFGWITVRQARANERFKYPVVKRK